MNPALRLAIKKAKAVNMPAANIERAIKSLDNILSYLRSYGKIPKDIEGISESAMLT